AAIVRFDDGEKVTVLVDQSGWYQPQDHPTLDPDWVVAAVRRTKRAARFDTEDPSAPGTPEAARATGMGSAVAAPVVVEGELWGAIAIGSHDRSLPPAAEQRLGDFTHPGATPVAHTHARQQGTPPANEPPAPHPVAAP